jgi:glyoxylase-like metal-dependent hydrolase (beta-lactamase superfamily II)
MSKFRASHAFLVASAVVCGLPLAFAAQEPIVAPNVYVNCQWHVAAIFPGQPIIRDISYSDAGKTVPARQFYFERGPDHYSVTVADFTNVGPAIDDQIVERAADTIRRKGEVKLQYPEDYSPGIPGRQLNVFDSKGRQYLGDVYMSDYRLYISETYAAPSDFAALQFEQSVLVLDGEGGDQNAVANRNRYACEKQPIAAQTPGDLVREAVAAEGGAQALRALTGLSVRGNARFWEPGQSATPGGEPRFLGTATFTTTWDLAGGRARTEWDRDQQYPLPAVKLKYTETLLPATGFVTDGTGNQPMSSVRIAAQLRELERASPRLLLKAMDNIANIRAVELQQLGERVLPAVSFVDGGTTFIVLFDPVTHLPAAIRTRDDDNIAGDSNYDLVLSDWTAISGARIAKSLSYQINGLEVAKLTYDAVSASPAIAANMFAVPAAIQTKVKAAATKDVPYQWVLRRLFLMRLTDSDALIYPDGGGLKLVELAPNVQHVQGGTANNLIVAMKDFLVVFDAPYGELQSRWTIDAAKAKYPGKPIKYLVLTHHHMDHTGGMRTYVAEGATVIVPSQSAEYLEKAIRNPHTLVPDALQKNPRAANVYGVFENMTIKDEAAEIRVYNTAAGAETAPRLPNPHVDGMLIGHVVDRKIVYVTDLISPRGAAIPRSPETIAVGKTLKEFDVNDADLIFAGGHGTTIKRAEIAAAIAPN